MSRKVRCVKPELRRLLEWAKVAVGFERARCGFPDPDDEERPLVPFWLPELEAAIDGVEAR